LVSTIGGGDDFVRVGGPDEGFGCPVVLGEKAVDGGLEVDNALEDASLVRAAVRMTNLKALAAVAWRRARARIKVGNSL
jgi:hypothetical protein